MYESICDELRSFPLSEPSMSNILQHTLPVAERILTPLRASTLEMETKLPHHEITSKMRQDLDALESAYESAKMRLGRVDRRPVVSQLVAMLAD